MNRRYYILILIFPFFLLGQENFPINGVKETNQVSYAFINAEIYINYNEIIKDATLIIKEDQIVEVGKKIKIPNGTVIYDLKGLKICPSFIDVFTDYGQNLTQKNKETLGSWNSALKTEYDAINHFSIDKERAKEFINSGFGLVNSLRKDGIIRGTSALTTLSYKNPHQSVFLKYSSLCMSFDKGTSKQAYPNSLMGSIALLRQAYYDLDWYENQNQTYNNSLEAFSEKKDLPKILEVKEYQSIFRAKKISKEFDENFIIKTGGDEYQRVDDIKKINTRLIVSLDFPEIKLSNDPYENLELSLKKLKHWEIAPYNPSILVKNGIQIAITTDDLKSLSDFNKNLNQAIKCGLSVKNTLKALTYNPAKFLKVYNKVGSISKGKKANFLIFGGDLFAEDFLIYQNWIDGEKHEINNLNTIKLLGEHTLFIDEKEEGVVQFFIKDRKLSGAFLVDSLNKKNIKKIDIIGHRVSFSKQNNFFSGTFNDLDFYGEMQDSTGKWRLWKMIKNIKEFEVIEKEEINNTYGNIVYPNMAYGLSNNPKQESILFQNGTVWTNEAMGIIKNCDVAIENGKIIAVGKNLKKGIFKNSKIVRVIDVTGKHITSGIIDEHSHIAIRKGVNEGTQAVTSEVRIGDVINADDINIYRQLSGGVTIAQLLHGSANPIGGQSAIIKLRWGQLAENLKFQKAKPFIKFALGENVKQSNWGRRHNTRFPQTRMGVEQIIYDAFIRAKEYANKSRNYKRKKIPKPRKDLELDALVEILKKERFITCHSYIQSEINMLMHIAEEFDFKVNTFTHVLEGYKIADKLKEHGASASTFSDWWAYKYEVNDAIPYNAALLTKMNVNTAINSDDAEMGRRLNQEAAKMVKYGNVSQEEAWKAVTLNPAKMLRIDNYVGSLRKNKDADIVIWSQNPLSIYAIAEQTYIDGRCYFSIEKDKKHRRNIKEEKNRLFKKLIKN